MALRSLKDRLQKLEARKPEHIGGDHSVENSATYEFTGKISIYPYKGSLSYISVPILLHPNFNIYKYMSV